jgi:hypothetical protein
MHHGHDDRPGEQPPVLEGCNVQHHIMPSPGRRRLSVEVVHCRHGERTDRTSWHDHRAVGPGDMPDGGEARARKGDIVQEPLQCTSVGLGSVAVEAVSHASEGPLDLVQSPTGAGPGVGADHQALARPPCARRAGSYYAQSMPPRGQEDHQEWCDKRRFTQGVQHRSTYRDSHYPVQNVRPPGKGSP